MKASPVLTKRMSPSLTSMMSSISMPIAKPFYYSTCQESHYTLHTLGIKESTGWSSHGEALGGSAKDLCSREVIVDIHTCGGCNYTAYTDPKRHIRVPLVVPLTNTWTCVVPRVFSWKESSRSCAPKTSMSSTDCGAPASLPFYIHEAQEECMSINTNTLLLSSPSLINQRTRRWMETESE